MEVVLGHPCKVDVHIVVPTMEGKQDLNQRFLEVISCQDVSIYRDFVTQLMHCLISENDYFRKYYADNIDE